jgi:hypothetical protein
VAVVERIYARALIVATVLLVLALAVLFAMPPV